MSAGLCGFKVSGDIAKQEAMMRKRDTRKRSKLQSNDYEVGYRRPPPAFRFAKGTSGNPEGKRKRPRAPNLRTDLQRALNKTIRGGNQHKTLSKGAAGIEHLVDQWAKGDRHARRDLIVLCEKLGIDLADRQALESALEDALSAEDEALLANFVKRHGGEYPARAETVPGLPAKDQNLLTPPADDRKLLTARRENLAGPANDSTEGESDD
jgi:hypothetical protein